MRISERGLSASAIKTFLHCPFQYYLSYVLKIRKGHSFATLNGQIIHAVLENYGLGHKKRWEKELLVRYMREKPWELLESFDKHRINCEGCKILKSLPELRTDIYEYARKSTLIEDTPKSCPLFHLFEGRDLIQQVLDRDLNPFDYKILGTEVEFRLDIGHDVLITGIIDMVCELDEDTIEIRDWKTGNFVPSYEDALNDPQLRLYDVALGLLYPQYKTRLLTFDYLKKTRYTFVINDEQREANRKWIISLAKKIKGTDDPIRDLTWKCKSFCLPDVCDVEYPKKLITIKKLKETGEF